MLTTGHDSDDLFINPLKQLHASYICEQIDLLLHSQESCVQVTMQLFPQILR